MYIENKEKVFQYVYMYIKLVFWFMSVLSLMPNREIVGIKLLLPIVITLSFISTVTKLHFTHQAFQC